MKPLLVLVDRDSLVDDRSEVMEKATVSAEDIIVDEEPTPEQQQASEAMARWQEAQIEIAELKAELIALRVLLEDAEVECDMEKARRLELAAQAAEMRFSLEMMADWLFGESVMAWFAKYAPGTNTGARIIMRRAMNKALSGEAGQGWISPEDALNLHQHIYQAVKERDDLRERLKR